MSNHRALANSSLLFGIYLACCLPDYGIVEILTPIHLGPQPVREEIMEIQSLNSNSLFSGIFPDRDGSFAAPAAAAQPAPDTVDVSSPWLLPDDEVDGVLDATMNMISQDNLAALSVHGGLSQSRVFALLGL